MVSSAKVRIIPPNPWPVGLSGTFSQLYTIGIVFSTVRFSPYRSPSFVITGNSVQLCLT